MTLKVLVLEEGEEEEQHLHHHQHLHRYRAGSRSWNHNICSAGSNGDGVVEAYDGNRDGRADGYDTNNDGVIDALDVYGTGRANAFDTDGDGVTDAYDTNGDGVIDKRGGGPGVNTSGPGGINSPDGSTAPPAPNYITRKLTVMWAIDTINQDACSISSPFEDKDLQSIYEAAPDNIYSDTLNYRKIGV